MQPRRMNRGFSLVELVIVIVIIGIIAAIAIPRVSRGSAGASESALVSNLAILRNAIELYASEHGGDYPGTKPDDTFDTTSTTFENQMLQYSDQDGNVSASPDPATYPYGPYLRKGLPPLPVSAKRGNTDVAIDTTNIPPAVVATEGVGWVYNPETGDIIANTSDDNDAGDSTYDLY